MSSPHPSYRIKSVPALFEFNGKVKQITEYESGDTHIEIVTTRGKINLVHFQDCCESITCVTPNRVPPLVGKYIRSITRDVYDEEAPLGVPSNALGRDHDSFSWTKFTINWSHAPKSEIHALEIFFLGESNGYYCEIVEMQLEPNAN